MQFFYDKQIRRYLVQIIRVFSNFTVKYGDGTLQQIPVMYGDADKQAASVMRGNSENVVQTVPRIAVHITDLSMDRSRLGDSSYVSKVHIRERDIIDGAYTAGQGKNYTVERLMPTPFKLTVKVDIWSSSTEQKLQILEQILVLFNPSLEIQSTDNYIDWTSLSVLELTTMSWSSRSVPVGTNDAIDIATLTLEAPIWISPPVKVKKLGVITNIITSIYQGDSGGSAGYIEGLGVDQNVGSITLGDILSTQSTTIGGDFGILVLGQEVQILNPGESSVLSTGVFDVPEKLGTPGSWYGLLDQYPGKYSGGAAHIFLTLPSGAEVAGAFAVNELDPSRLTISEWSNKPVETFLAPFKINGERQLNTLSAGTFDRVIDPLTFNPGTVQPGTRYLLVEDIGNDINNGPSTVWGSLVAKANDIIEWDGAEWLVIFDSQEPNQLYRQKNIYTGIQYTWNGLQWSRSFEGEYKAGSWRIVL